MVKRQSSKLEIASSSLAGACLVVFCRRRPCQGLAGHAFCPAVGPDMLLNPSSVGSCSPSIALNRPQSPLVLPTKTMAMPHVSQAPHIPYRPAIGIARPAIRLWPPHRPSISISLTSSIAMANTSPARAAQAPAADPADRNGRGCRSDSQPGLRPRPGWPGPGPLLYISPGGLAMAIRVAHTPTKTTKGGAMA